MEVQEIIQAMSNKGMRITEQRKTLARLFVDHEGYLTPKEVYEAMVQTYAGMSFDTVYRNLRVLQEMDIVEQFMFEDGIKFRLRCHTDEHHHHFICLECERTIPFHYCPMDHVQQYPEGFKPVKHKFDIYGYCETCQSGQSRQAAAR
ncbi:Fur family transcriptional regulator [Marinicrinis sediminis]|uniref:Fur family transcriptional regulator n=1 Tax=Marinicrinis sediminis TaxID=1652465 RepID=A0ABW5RCE1_9BACL